VTILELSYNIQYLNPISYILQNALVISRSVPCLIIRIATAANLPTNYVAKFEA
jgi:hypothetical protein